MSCFKATITATRHPSWPSIRAPPIPAVAGRRNVLAKSLRPAPPMAAACWWSAPRTSGNWRARSWRPPVRTESFPWPADSALGALAALLERCDVLLGNDSGPRHLAQALGTPTVGLYWVGNLINAGPLGRSLHRVHLSWATQCPECGADITQVGWTAARCAHDTSLLAGISAADVYRDVRLFTATSPPPRGR